MKQQQQQQQQQQQEQEQQQSHEEQKEKQRSPPQQKQQPTQPRRSKYDSKNTYYTSLILVITFFMTWISTYWNYRQIRVDVVKERQELHMIHEDFFKYGIKNRQQHFLAKRNAITANRLRRNRNYNNNGTADQTSAVQQQPVVRHISNVPSHIDEHFVRGSIGLVESKYYYIETSQDDDDAAALDENYNNPDTTTSVTESTTDNVEAEKSDDEEDDDDGVTDNVTQK